MSKIRNKILKQFLKSEIVSEKIDIINESYIPITESDKQSIQIEPGLEISDETIEIIHEFMDFLKEQLQLEELPKISILLNRKEGMTYGSYDPNNNIIHVLGKNRGLADIFRTAAHELVHHFQNLENRIPKNMNGRNVELEAEANTKAGDYIYMFGLKNPKVYDIVINPENVI